jgi:hypothetical protein
MQIIDPVIAPVIIILLQMRFVLIPLFSARNAVPKKKAKKKKEL